MWTVAAPTEEVEEAIETEVHDTVAALSAREAGRMTASSNTEGDDRAMIHVRNDDASLLVT